MGEQENSTAIFFLSSHYKLLPLSSSLLPQLFPSPFLLLLLPSNDVDLQKSFFLQLRVDKKQLTHQIEIGLREKTR
jgi:hypothetical protein